MAERPQPHQLQVHPQYGAGKGFQQREQPGPSAGKILAVITLLPVGGTLLFLAGLTFIGTLIGLAVSTPVFLLFSPILVPASITIGLAIAGFLTSGAFGITGLSSLSWVFNYFKRTSVPEQLDYAKRRAPDIAGQKAKEAGQKAKEVGQEAQTKAQEGKKT